MVCTHARAGAHNNIKLGGSWGGAVYCILKALLSRGFKHFYGGEGGIRTLDTLPYTRFPGVRLRPLGHLTIRARSISQYRRLASLRQG
jgi:hypothetical protein